MSIFSEVIGAQQAQAQEPRNVEDQRLQMQQFLQNRALAQAEEQRVAQQFQMGLQEKQRAQQEAQAEQQAQSMGLAAYQNYLKNPEMAPQTGPGVNLVPGQAPPQAPAFSFDVVSRSILKRNPNISPQAFTAAMKQFEPQFESADKMKLAQFQSLARCADSPQEQIYNTILKEQGPAAAQKWWETNKRASPEEAGAVALEKLRAKTTEGREAGLSKAQNALTGFKQNAQIVTDTIDKALATISKSPTATGYGALLTSGLPNTPARSLKNYLDTIKANIGFDKLQAMRENSPTGGALGPVSDFENRLLQATSGALDPLQGAQLEENLKIIKDLYPKVIAEREKAFNMDYGAAVETKAGAGETPTVTKTIDFNDWK